MALFQEFGGSNPREYAIFYHKGVCQIKDLIMFHFHFGLHCFRNVITAGAIVEVGILGKGEEVVDVVG